jgi:type IV secretory pathway VirB2 component (pilin)
VSPLEPGPIYAPGAGPPHPAVQRRRAQAAAAAAARQAAEREAAAQQAAAQRAPAAQPAATGQPTPVAQPTAVAQPVPARARAARAHRRFDWVLGIVIGIVLGLAVAAGFVFIGSEDTVDAPRIQGIDTGRPGGATGPTGAAAETEKLPSE